ncbi:MAG: leucine-rich repeat domain-containing protein, partial [Muribaculaceae bacterium]|nr:leucine-rich repeat domain-containing protein [Muribaculaceae bacterium]
MFIYCIETGSFISLQSDINYFAKTIMKHSGFHRTIVAIAMMLIGWLPSLAHDFEVDGVFYDKLNSSKVAVTYKGKSYSSYSNEYAGDVVIPSSVNYNGINYDVTSIGDEAFRYCYSLTSIQIPNSVTSIGYDAFEGCESLTSIEIPNSVTSIGARAFGGCDSLTSIVVDAGNTKYDSRNDCNAIIKTASNTLIAGCQNTIIPNSVKSIGDYAFMFCSSLTSIQIPNSVTSIGYDAFSYCTSLTSIQIPNSVTSIGESAFFDCFSLTSIQIPNSVTSIGDYAFC